MAETRTTRMGLPQWSAGTDQPSRADFNEAFLALEEKAARFAQGIFSARPAAGVQGRFYTVVGDGDATKNGLMFYDTGAAWISVGSNTASTGTNVITSPSAGTVALKVMGASGQTANLQEWRNSAGTLVGYITKDGGANFTASAYSGGTTFEDIDVTDMAEMNVVDIQTLTVLGVAVMQQYKSASNRADGTPKTDIRSDGSARMDGLIAPGAILGWAGDTAPTGWSLCRGQSLVRTAYPDLFATIGTSYGSVNGLEFSLPDMRSRFPLGVGLRDRGASDAVSESARITALGHIHNHTINTDNAPHHHGVTSEVAAHYHGISNVSHNGSANAQSGGSQNRVGTIAGTVDGSHDHTGATGNGGAHSHSVGNGNATHNHGGTVANSAASEHPYITINYIIKL